jgi:hypothetical protein
LLAAALASWVMAPPHGIHVHLEFMDGIGSRGAWPAAIASVLVFASVARTRRERLH